MDWTISQLKVIQATQTTVCSGHSDRVGRFGRSGYFGRSGRFGPFGRFGGRFGRRFGRFDCSGHSGRSTL